jgi:hypothetical protein
MTLVLFVRFMSEQIAFCEEHTEDIVAVRLHNKKSLKSTLTKYILAT